MPSTSKKQADFMRAVAHSPEFAKKVGVPVSVGKEFTQEDKETKMKRYMKGGKMPSAPSLPSQASPKAAEAMKRFAGARGMKSGGATKMQAGGAVNLRGAPMTPVSRMKDMPAAGRSFRNVPTLPAQASQRARDIMASRMPITTPGGPAEMTPSTPPSMPQVEVMPAVMPRVPLKRPVGMAMGGKTGKSRMDGCAMKGKTKGRMV